MPSDIRSYLNEKGIEHVIESLRLAEIRNWLEAEVRPRAGNLKC
jgi:hypothetical protein